MKSVFMLVIGLALGCALGAFGYDHFVAKPDREFAAWQLTDQKLQMDQLKAHLDPQQLLAQRELLMKQVELLMQANDDLNKGRDKNQKELEKCQTAQASAGLPIPGKKK